MLVERLEDLLIHQIALQLAKEVHELVGAIPFNWKIKEVDDIKRSSSSVPSNISEGFSQRFYTKKFLLYLYIALGSSDETQDHLKKLYNNGHINSERASLLHQQLQKPFYKDSEFNKLPKKKAQYSFHTPKQTTIVPQFAPRPPEADCPTIVRFSQLESLEHRPKSGKITQIQTFVIF